ncbi:UNVERIFIED_CONTAM: RAP domain-containing protein [Hammondia hammondi]|eukprot:XP_008882367.1 RAP domain-containing protein [Hammondia hammondi]
MKSQSRLRRLASAVQTMRPFRRTVRDGHRHECFSATPCRDAEVAFSPEERATEGHVPASRESRSSRQFVEVSTLPRGVRPSAPRLLQHILEVGDSRQSSTPSSQVFYSNWLSGLSGINSVTSFATWNPPYVISLFFARNGRFAHSSCLRAGSGHLVETSQVGDGREREAVRSSATAGDSHPAEERQAEETVKHRGDAEEVLIDTRLFDECIYTEEEDILEKKRRIGVGMGVGGSAPHRRGASFSLSVSLDPPFSSSDLQGPSPFTLSSQSPHPDSLPPSPPHGAPFSPTRASPSALSSSPKLVPVSEYRKLSWRFPPDQVAVGAFDLAVKFETLVSLRFPLDQHARRAQAGSRSQPSSLSSSRPLAEMPRPYGRLPPPVAFEKMLGEAISIAKANADILPVSTLLSVAHAAARLGVQVFSFASALRRRALVLLPEIKNPAAFIRLLQDLEKLGGLGDRHFVFFREKVKETLQSASSRCSLFGTTLVVHLLARHRLRDEELLTLAYRRFSRNRYTLAAAVRQTPSLLAALPLALSRLEAPTLAAAVLDSLLSDQAPATVSQLSIHELSNLAYAIACVSTNSQVTVDTDPSSADSGSCHEQRPERFGIGSWEKADQSGLKMQLKPEQRSLREQYNAPGVDPGENNATGGGVGDPFLGNKREKNTSFKVLETRAVCTPEELRRRSTLLTTILRTLSRSSLRRHPLNSPFERAWRQMQIIDLYLQFNIGPLRVDDEEALQFLSLARTKKLLNLVHVSQVQKRVGRLLFDEGLMSEINVEYPLGPYVLDFAIPSRKLVVEVDGEAHFFFGTTVPTAQTRMKRELLAAMGWHLVVVPQELWRNKRKGKIKEFVARKVREGLEIDNSDR